MTKNNKDLENKDLSIDDLPLKAEVENKDIKDPHLDMFPKEVFVKAYNKLNSPALINLNNGEVLELAPKGESKPFRKSLIRDLSKYSNILISEV